MADSGVIPSMISFDGVWYFVFVASVVIAVSLGWRCLSVLVVVTGNVKFLRWPSSF